ncbi:MAG: hypothetical protein AB1641_24870 [Thermodesulfobacteriota bacterium]
MIINFLGAGVQALWLIFDPLQMAFRGWITLWIVAGVVPVIGLVEAATGAWKD